MTVLRMDHVGVCVDDLPAAIEFFAELGLELSSEMTLSDDPVVDRVVGLEDVRSNMAFMRTPDGSGQIELFQFASPPFEGERRDEPSHAPGLRHVTFAVDDLGATLDRLRPLGAELVGEVAQYGSSYKLCYLRGPAGIIVELAEKLGSGD